MQLEVGAVLEGKVTGITKFGAFVELGENKTGMVHISEVAPVYVEEIREHLQEGQTVKVKVLNVGDDGRISLSIKKAAEPAPRPARPAGAARARPAAARSGAGTRPPAANPGRPGGYEWQPQKSDNSSFEDMMSRFKQRSEEKISDLKRGTDSKHGGFSKRGRGHS
ncbi:MAG: S1 RNA-binding domain-containing protein [Oscillospiraceae bacterium]|nr:S1 RNA-binding domain-containing protein [Oscillospiraceae bacterium]